MTTMKPETKSKAHNTIRRNNGRKTIYMFKKWGTVLTENLTAIYIW
jgi:hypothetical protein